MTEELPTIIGPYKIIRAIGRGGMGEVFLAHDPIFEREVALKRIRADIKNREVIKKRFLREAKITAQLAHPSIVPIYALQEDGESLYYTMPYVEGKTLKELLLKPEESTIASLSSVFFAVCQAIAFAHSRGFIHRDIKPENILVGKYGQVQILDWGLVKAENELETDTDFQGMPEDAQVTLPGKIVGTLAYMAPERVLGHPSTVLSDIYALGVILYQILTLRLPFRRNSVKEFKLHIKDERFIDPSLRAPYRDVPPELVRIARKCLFKQPRKRYQTVDHIISDLKAYFEGRSQWFAKAKLDIDNSKHWLFQEHIVIPEHNLIIRGLESTEWALMMVSEPIFSGNVRLVTRVRFEKECRGLGLMLALPGEGAPRELIDGFCLWLMPSSLGASALLKSNVTLAEIEGATIEPEKEYLVVFERVENKINVLINNAQVLSYTNHLPITPGHIGVLFKDRKFLLQPLYLFVGSLNLATSCLSIPDAFLACHHYGTALAEYRRIGAAFSGRAEGREALFRAGITLLEEAKINQDPALKELKLEQARHEFEKLSHTAAQPLEYLGKALIYQSTQDSLEEAKCFQLAFRRYKDHPLLEPLEEHLLLRLHESSRKDRTAAFRFMLIALQELPPFADQSETAKLIKRLERYNEPLPFACHMPQMATPRDKQLCLAIQLAFWLTQTGALQELAELADDPILKQSALSCLFHLGAGPTTESFEDQIFAFDEELSKDRPIAKTADEAMRLDCSIIWKNLKIGLFEEAYERLNQHPLAVLSQEMNILHFLFGCFLLAVEGEEIASAHFSGLFNTPFPRSWQIATHFLYSPDFDRGAWLENAFFWEKKQLYRQLILFYTCAGDEEKRAETERLLDKLLQ